MRESYSPHKLITDIYISLKKCIADAMGDDIRGRIKVILISQTDSLLSIIRFFDYVS